jgi:hypothetical protein
MKLASFGGLFGDTLAFCQGQVGSWPSFFKRQHKKSLKEVMGPDLNVS